MSKSKTNSEDRRIPFITSSILGMYIDCKFSFLKFYENDGYTTYRQDSENDTPIYLTFGTLMHSVIEQFWKGKDRTKRFMMNSYENGIVESGLVDKSYIELGYEIINNFFGYLLRDVPKRKWLYSELSFKVNIKGVPLHGTIDAIFYHGDGIYEIEDYKTSTWIPTQAEVDENIQLTMYDLVFSDESMSRYWYKGIKPKGIILTLHFLKHNVRVQTERTAYSRVSALNYFRLVYNQMKVLDASKFTPCINKFCSYCSYTDECEAYTSVVDGTCELSEDEYNYNESNLENYINLQNQIKILKSESDYYYDLVYGYLSKEDATPLQLDGYEYYLSQRGRRYVKKDMAIDVMIDNGIWDKKLQKACSSIPVSLMDEIIKKNPKLEYELQKAVGYSYNSPSLTSRKMPKLFKKSGKGGA